MRVLITGAYGFLGWHTRARLHALTTHELVPIGRHEWPDLSRHLNGVDAVVHLAGVNRGDDDDVREGNVRLARDLANAVRSASSVRRIVYGNSIQADNPSPYGAGKSTASMLLEQAAADVGAAYVDVRLPNLFGEHGRPHYNSFVATFASAVVQGANPVIVDRPVDLLHAQNAAQTLIEALATTRLRLDPLGCATTVQAVFDILHEYNELYSVGDIPPLLTNLQLDLFNTLRAARFPDRYPIFLSPRDDRRGRLIEAVRAHGGEGQTFVSTTKPGLMRGEHFHLKKVERFVVLSGRARISLRRLFDVDVRSFDVTGDQPMALDMPTMWVHNIQNTGETELTTLFWTHELFDPDEPDTYAEAVGAAGQDG